MTWDQTSPPPGWRYSYVAGGWQQQDAAGEWHLAEPPPEAYGPAPTQYELNESNEESPPAPGVDTLSSSNSFTSYPQEAPEPWPSLDPAALHGIAGLVVKTLGPHTEADPAGLLLCFLAAAGNILGRGPHAIADAGQHPARLNVVLVGKTSRARKGTAWAQVHQVVGQAAPDWIRACLQKGLGSGEALIERVSDEAATDGEDLRCLVLEPEFARLLAVMGREGNTLSANLRDAWDGQPLEKRTLRDKLKATGPHMISLLGHVTREELLRRLDSTEAANGFANRCLFALVRRSKLLPEGGNLDSAELDWLALQVQNALTRGEQIGLLRRSDAARKLWAEAYEDFGDGDDLAGAVTARPEAQVLRLSVTYAALDGSDEVEVSHLQAALAVWRYCETSAHLIFGDATGDPIADRLLAALREAGEAGLDGTAQHRVFGRNVSANRLALAREVLGHRGLITTTSEKTGGRDRLVSKVSPTKNEERTESR